MPDTPLHTTRIPVRWGDMDALGHVNNARYFTYAEQARIAWMEAVHPDDWAESGPILASISADYKRPIHYPATVEVRVLPGRVGRTSLGQRYELRVDGETACEMDAVIVWVSRETGRPVPLPETIRAAASSEAVKEV